MQKVVGILIPRGVYSYEAMKNTFSVGVMLPEIHLRYLFATGPHILFRNPLFRFFGFCFLKTPIRNLRCLFSDE